MQDHQAIYRVSPDSKLLDRHTLTNRDHCNPTDPFHKLEIPHREHRKLREVGQGSAEICEADLQTAGGPEND